LHAAADPEHPNKQPVHPPPPPPPPPAIIKIFKKKEKKKKKKAVIFVKFFVFGGGGGGGGGGGVFRPLVLLYISAFCLWDGCASFFCSCEIGYFYILS